MVGNIFNRSLAILRRKPIVLWSTSIAYSVIAVVIQVVFAFAPFISIPAVLTLSAGMSALYLEGYNGVEITAEQLFRGFSRKHKCFPRVTLGMLWHSLWTIIWMLVPIAGIVKVYQYRFTPYILLSRPEVSPVEALILSKKETKGHKLAMFATDFVIWAVLLLILALLAVITVIPFIGWVICVVGVILLAIFMPLFKGLIMAGFYQEAQNAASQQNYFNQNSYGYQQRNAGYNNQSYQASDNMQKPSQTAVPAQPAVQPTEALEQPVRPKEPPAQPIQTKKWFCTQCGTQNEGEALFCKYCGYKKLS
ncbi:MAG: zinc-ribbon domain-containing protein [Candidatus Ornithomonoglobus sp.]